MIRKIIIIALITIVNGRDIYVSKAERENYETDDYLLFDTYNDTMESLHPPHPSYYPAWDAVVLGDEGPVLGQFFTQEVMIYREKKRVDWGWGFLMGHEPQEDQGGGVDPNNPGRVVGNVNEQAAPHIYKANVNGSGSSIQYGFGSGDSYNVVIVEDVISEKGVWYHIATTFDGTNYKLYVNGELVHNYLGCAGKTPYPTPVKYIGGTREGSGKLTARMDEVRMWNYPRTQGQIQAKMNKKLTGNELGLAAYYPMDIHNQYLIDHSGNDHHGEMIGPIVRSRYFSSECPEPDGSMNCPYPTIETALEHVQPWDRIILREGRYTEFIMRDGLNDETGIVWGQLDPDFGGPRTNTITIEPYPNERVVIDGTISIDVDWRPTVHNGHPVFKATLDSSAIADQIQRPFRDVYGVWIDERYQVPAVTPNIKNPTDPSYGGPNDQVPGTYWETDVEQSEVQDWNVDREEGLARLNWLDNLEEWAYDPASEELYIYADPRFIPTSTNVRIRVLHRMIHIRRAVNLEFRNLEFFGGSIKVEGANILFEDCEFKQLHDITLPALMLDGSRCTGLYTWNAEFVNCRFSEIPFVYNVKIRGHHSRVENCLFTNMDWWTHPGGGGAELGNIARYVTFENSKIGGLGGSPLMEYCRIEDFKDPCDCSGINKGAHGAPRSMTRYNWIINGPGANGMRIDGGATGAGNRRGDIHHIVTIGNNRGMRLKGDYHDVHHVTAYDNRMFDVDLFVGKYGEPGEFHQDFHLGYTPGNINTEISNSLIEQSFTCPSPDCWDYPESVSGGNQPMDAPLLLDQGIWFGSSLGHSSILRELVDPWYLWLYEYESSNEYPINNRSQDYDFRPRKGSTLIDAGVVIPGINDGQDLQFNRPPSFPGQNRRFVGDAPDIGAYEYGDSVYWIPGYRYPHPSFPIPRNNAVDVIPDYSVVWNYPYKKDYTGTTATVTINGPGINRTELFNYPNNVCFQPFQPSGNYTWSVMVDGKSGGLWTFQVDNDIYPLNDRSVDTTMQGTILPTKQKFLDVKRNHVAFIRFEVPPSVQGEWDIDLNLFVAEVHSLESGIVIYNYDQEGWGESNNEMNIGVLDQALGTALDTIFSLDPTSSVLIDMDDIITGPGEYSFALGVIDSSDHVSFYSNEADNFSKFTPYGIYYPSLSFAPSVDSVDIVLTTPVNDTTIAMNASSDDSIQFEWNFSHGVDVDIQEYHLVIGLPYSTGTRDMDTSYIELYTQDNQAKVSKSDLLGMLMEVNLSQGLFTWTVTGDMGDGKMQSIASGRFSTSMNESGHETTLPDEFKLYENFPNPFNPSTTISYDLKEWSLVKVDFYDLLGRNILSIRETIKPPGQHSFQFYGNDQRGQKLPSGIYFYHLTVNEPMNKKEVFSGTKKMMIVK
tara:strand:+ start:1606 stop:5766 length:4161 start_codon:yes stop_codon:yes gene_type:complete